MLSTEKCHLNGTVMKQEQIHKGWRLYITKEALQQLSTSQNRIQYPLERHNQERVSRMKT